MLIGYAQLLEEDSLEKKNLDQGMRHK